MEEEAKEEYFEEEERRRRAKAKAAPPQDSKDTSKSRESQVEELKLPFLMLDVTLPPSQEKLHMAKELPKISKEKRQLVISPISLEKPSPQWHTPSFDKELPVIAKKKRAANLPTITLFPLPKISQLLVSFDDSIPEPLSASSSRIPVPLYKKFSLVKPRAITGNLDSTLDETMAAYMSDLHTERIHQKLEVSQLERQAAAPEPSSPSTVEEEEGPPPVIEMLAKLGRGRSSASGPQIILFKDLENDSYIKLLELICARMYREKAEGEPQAKEISKFDEINKREIERWLDAGDKIFTIDISNDKSWLEVDEDQLKDRLEETYSERFGFVIFTSKEKQLVDKYDSLLNSLFLRSQGRINVVNIIATKLPLKLANIMWAWSLDSTPEKGAFDFVLNAAMHDFDRKLEEVMLERDGLYKAVTNRNKGQIEGKKAESDLHYKLKTFVVRYLINKLEKEKRKELKDREEIMKSLVKTEQRSNESDPVPDIELVDSGEVYEIETLFGEGAQADKKIDETVDKYDGTGIKKVNIVMDNFGFMIHSNDISNKRKYLKDKLFSVEFFAIDLREGTLVSFTDLMKELGKPELNAGSA